VIITSGIIPIDISLQHYRDSGRDEIGFLLETVKNLKFYKIVLENDI
jgi:hypothetical protein